MLNFDGVIGDGAIGSGQSKTRFVVRFQMFVNLATWKAPEKFLFKTIYSSSS